MSEETTSTPATTKPAKPKSKRVRWAEALRSAREALDAARGAFEEHEADLHAAFQDLEDVRAEYEETYESMSEKAQEGERGERFRAIAQDISPDEGIGAIDTILGEFDTLSDLLDAVESAELP